MALDRYDLSRGTGGDTVHEDYSDEMFMIDPTETPFMSMLPRKRVKNTLHEWSIERLNAPMFNAYPDGAAFDVQLYDASNPGGTVDTAGFEGGNNVLQASSGNPYAIGTGLAAIAGTGPTSFGAAPGYNVPERVGVHCQISRKEIEVTRRADLVNTAGRRSELGRIRALRLLELRRDMEMIALANQPTRAGSSGSTNAVAPLTAGVPAWIGSSRAGPQASARYNTASAASTASTDPVLSGGSGVFGQPTTAVDDSSSTPAAFTETLWLNVHKAVRENGGKPGYCMVPWDLKQQISQFLLSTSTRILAQNQDHPSNTGPVAVQGAVDVYKTDHGNIKVVPNRWMRATDVLLLDESKWACGILDGMKREKIAKTHDSYREMHIIDWCIISRHEGANGIIRDVDASAAMTA